MDRRTLRLKREVLAEIDASGMAGVVGGQQTRIACATLLCDTATLNTCFSCLTYISCNPAACIIRDVTECVTTVTEAHITGAQCV